MAKKQKNIEAAKHVTRRQLSRKEKERKTQRIVIISGVILLILVLALAGFGYYDSQYKPYHQVVLEVNNTKIDMNYYLDMLQAYLSGTDADSASLMANAVLGAIENNILIIQNAPQLGFTVAESEIDTAIAENNLPNKAAYRDIFAAQTLQQKLSNDYFSKKVPESVEHVKVEAMVFESQEIANEATTKINEGETFIKMAEIYGVEKVTKERGGDLGWLPKDLAAAVLGYSDASVLEKIAFSLAEGEISQPIYDENIIKGTGYWLVKVDEKDAENSARIRVILLGSLEEAQEVKKELEEGSDFATLAREVSQDMVSKEDGGDLGWLQKGYDDNLVSEAAFKMESGEISEPIHDLSVETKGGYWVVRVLEKEENKLLDTAVRDKLIQDGYQEWLQQQAESSAIQEFLTEEQKTWAISKVIRQLGG